MYADEFVINDYEPSRKMNIKFPMIFRPCRELESYVSCYWLVIFTGTRQDAEKLKPKTTVLIPDGCASFIFNVQPKLNQYNGIAWGVQYHPVIVYNQLSISKGQIRTFAVDFKPGGLYRFYTLPMNKLANISIKLETISPVLFNDITERIIHAGSVGMQIQILESFLLELLIKGKSLHHSVTEALYLINKNTGNISVRELSKILLISERHLNRLFHESVGIPPKIFCRMTRLQSIFRLCHEDRHTNFLMAAYDSGYFDQSHFIKDFKEFCGCTPSKYKFNH